MKRFAGLKGTIILLVLIIGMVAYYGYLSNKSSEQKETDATLTKVQNVLLRDMKLNYPPTVKEVVKYFGDIVLCLYDPKCEESDIDKLAAQAIQLYDKELLDNNPWADYITDLRQEVADFKTKEMKITGYATAGSANVNFFKQDGYEWARIYCSFYMVEKGSSRTVNEIFLLRKDEEGLWKIYGWDLAQNVNIPEG